MSCSMWDKKYSNPAEEKGSQVIFSTDAIKKTLNPFTSTDGRITGHNFLKNNEWLIRTSSQMGALTIDIVKDGNLFAERFCLTADGWLPDVEVSAAAINTEFNTALKYKDQLFTLLSSLPILEGMKQIIPPEALAVKEKIYNIYMVATSYGTVVEPKRLGESK